MPYLIWKGAARRTKLIVAGLALALVVAVPVAWAAVDFTDVPPSSPFYNDINSVRDAGITAGKTCVPPGTPPTYCPSEVINRQAMAAFVHRGFGRSARAAGSVLLTTAVDTDVAVVTISVGGVAGNTQFVILNAGISGEITPTDSSCPCETAFRLTQDGAGAVTGYSFFTNTLAFASGFNTAGGGATTVVAVPTASTQTFRLVAQVDGGTGSVFERGTLSASTVPFGSTGGATSATPALAKTSAPRG